MLQSQLFTKTKKEAPRDEKSVNAILLQRAGFVHKEMAGAYTFLPLGRRVLKKIEEIIREEMEKVSGQEILMTILQPKNLWLKTDRWEKDIGKVMYKCQGEEGISLAPTHEEMLTNIVRNYIHSFEDLPLYIYQIQTKFRKEPRAKSGLLRGREFNMKDLYSFHSTEADLKRYYEKLKKSYFAIFKRCGLKAILTEASGAGFTKDFTHEFQVLAEGGEDTIIYCPKHHFSKNKEIAKLKKEGNCPICKGKLREGKSIEVGNIFPLGTKYSQAIGAFFRTKHGERKPIIMGCYGIGISRTMGAVVETHHDKKGIIWPKSISPLDIHLLSLESGKKMINAKIKRTCQDLYNDLKNSGISVLYDNREGKSPGEKFADADLIGIPIRVVVSERTLEKDSVEMKRRDEEKTNLVKINKSSSFLEKYVK